MTIAALSERLGIPTRTLYRYRRSHPGQAPKSFDDLEAWIEFIGKIRSYSSTRTRPLDQNGTEPSAEDQNGEFSPGAERKERILRLRLGNQVRRTSLEQLRQNTVTVAECEATLEAIKRAVSAELLSLPGTLSHQLANREPQYIQQVLDTAFRSSLERLSLAKTYLSAQSC